MYKSTIAATDRTLLKAISEMQLLQKAIQEELAGIRQVQQAILAKLNHTVEVEELPEDIHLPLTSNEEVDPLEESLKTKIVVYIMVLTV